jgi:hypothetical protein
MGRREGELMPARIRDVIVVTVLVAAGILAVLTWHPLGRWGALGIALVGVLVAAGVYRARPSAFPLFGARDIGELEVQELNEPPEPIEAPRPTEAPSTRRPS